MKHKRTTATWGQTTNGSYRCECKRNAQECFHSCLAHSRGSKTSDLYLNGVNTQAGSCFEIHSKIIKKDGLRRLQAEPLQAQLIYPGVWLTDSFQAGLHNLREGQKGEINVPKSSAPTCTLVYFFIRRAGGGQLRFVNNK